MNLKVHCKLCLVVRQRPTAFTLRAISTGNYNRRRRRSDIGLFTADEAVLDDITSVQLADGLLEPPPPLALVAPVGLRRGSARRRARCVSSQPPGARSSEQRRRRRRDDQILYRARRPASRST